MLKKRGKEEQSEQKQNMGRGGRWLRIAAVSFVCVILAGVSFTVYSKYYKTGHNKGVSVASGFYFASDFMTELEKEDQVVKQVADLKTMTDRLHVTASGSQWSTLNNGSTSSTVHVHINNFSNQLLYNDMGLNVEYTVEFLLMDEPLNVTCQIKKAVGEGAGNYQPLGTLSAVTYTGGKLMGGTHSTETYDIEVTITDLSNYTPVKILALAYPTEPSYVKENRKIAGIITADYVESELRITDQGFTIETELEKAEGDSWKTMLLAESGLEYQIRTTGSYTGDGEAGMKKKLVLTWNSNMYLLDDMDKYKRELKEKYKDDPVVLAEYLNEGDADGHGWMKVDILPYSSIKFRFYEVPDSGNADKKVGFENAVVNDLSDLDAFKATVHAEIE